MPKKHVQGGDHYWGKGRKNHIGKKTRKQHSIDENSETKTPAIVNYNISRVDSLQNSYGHGGRNNYQENTSPSSSTREEPGLGEQRMAIGEFPNNRRLSFHQFLEMMGRFSQVLSLLILPPMPNKSRMVFLKHCAFQCVLDLGPRCRRFEQECKRNCPLYGRRDNDPVGWIHLGEAAAIARDTTTWCHVDDVDEEMDNSTWFKAMQQDMNRLLDPFVSLAKADAQKPSVMLVWPKDDNKAQRMVRSLHVLVEKLPAIPNITICMTGDPVTEVGVTLIKNIYLEYKNVRVYRSRLEDLLDAISSQVEADQKDLDVSSDGHEHNQVALVSTGTSMIQRAHQFFRNVLTSHNIALPTMSCFSRQNAN